jgi:2-keto-4-pentenoate hydratase/2-oxohepta-3-ene-1,7-dioic acid hydratase in catechol pathway
MEAASRIVRFEENGRPAWGRVDAGGRVEILTDAPWRGGVPMGEARTMEDLRLLAPVEPSKIVCVGRNYAAHARELGNELPEEPLLFLKPPSAIVGPADAIVIPPDSTDVQHEAELAVVIGRRCRNVPEAEVPSVVFGFTCLNDVTARDIQRKEKHLTRSKSFDTFCAVGPWIAEGWIEPSGRRVRCRVDGELRQDGNTSDMVFSVQALVAFVSRIMTLEPGDLVATGTPSGVGPLRAGNRVEVEVEGVGALVNLVR